MTGPRTKRERGDGSIQPRGKRSWRLRYRVNGQRFETTFTGTKAEAQKQLRTLLHSGDTGEHVTPDRLTVGAWIEHWISIGCPGNKKRQQVSERTIERYAQLLRVHVVPTLKDRPLQQLQASEIDALYVQIGQRVSARTARHVHSVFNACLGTAARTKRIVRNPMIELAKIPSPGEADHGAALDADQLRALVQAFKGSSLFAIVATAAGTGARRGEILALQVGDLDPDKKTLRIARAVEETKKHGLRLKPPKTKRGTRTIQIDDDLCTLLVQQIERLKRVKAGIPDGAATAVDLSLVTLPDDALIFPATASGFSFVALRRPRNVTKEFDRKAKALGFDCCFHDLRGSHETALLDVGVPVHVVAARCGHDPAVLLRSYAKRTHKADTSAATAIGAMLKGAFT